MPNATSFEPVPMEVAAPDCQDQALKSKGETTTPERNQNPKGGNKGNKKKETPSKQNAKTMCAAGKGDNYTMEVASLRGRIQKVTTKQVRIDQTTWAW